MSGRSLHMRGGELITNRKTDRRQTPVRSIRERLDAINLKPFAPRPGNASAEVRLAFRLPKFLKGFVASGKHGIGTNVLTGDFVQITSYSVEQCYELARDFLAIVCKDKPSFIETASIISSKDAGRTYGRWLIVVRGALVMCGGMVEPRVLEAK
jgi:hypothetical protein